MGAMTRSLAALFLSFVLGTAWAQQPIRILVGFAVSRDAPATNLAEFFAWAKANPSRANVGIPAPGSIPQFFVFTLSRQANAPLSSVPYRGSAPLVQDLLGGQIAAGTTALGDF